MINEFLKIHVLIDKEDDKEGYGLGVYIHKSDKITFYYAVGGDYGVDFFTAYIPNKKLIISALGNTETNTFPLLEIVVSELLT